MKAVELALAALALFAPSGCGSDPPGGMLTPGTEVQDAVTTSDPMRTGPNGVALRGDARQDAWTTTLVGDHSYVLQVCPVHAGWDPVINVVPEASTDTDDFVYCELAGQGSPERCVFRPTAGGNFTVYVGSFASLDMESASREYTLRIADGDSTSQGDCPVLQ